MALTEAEETALKQGLADTQKLLAELTPAVTALKTELAAKDTVIKDLSSRTTVLSQDAETQALKAKFPDVPMETLKAIPEAARMAQGEILQAAFGKVKAPQGFKTGPNAWDNVGGFQPSIEAEADAALAERTAQRDTAVQKGDYMGVLRAKSRDAVEFIQKNFASR